MRTSEMLLRHVRTREVVRVWLVDGDPVRAKLVGLPTRDSFIYPPRGRRGGQLPIDIGELVLAGVRREMLRSGAFSDETPGMLGDVA